MLSSGEGDPAGPTELLNPSSSIRCVTIATFTALASISGVGALAADPATAADYAPGVVLAQVAAIVSDGGWLQGAMDGRTAAGKAAGY